MEIALKRSLLPRNPNTNPQSNPHPSPQSNPNPNPKIQALTLALTLIPPHHNPVSNIQLLKNYEIWIPVIVQKQSSEVLVVIGLVWSYLIWSNLV